MSEAIFAATTRHAEWLAHRRTIIAGNVAHAGTPGFQARDVAPFDLTVSRLQRSAQTMAAGHIAPRVNIAPAAVISEERTAATHSGNSVDLDVEMSKLSDINRQHAINTAITKAFHRMVLVGVRG
jgi:flagellar basal-body rod protein FlgB